MAAEERLNRALAARAAPAKDLPFTLEVMRRAEAERFRAAALRRVLWGAGLAALAGAAILPVADLAATNPDLTLDALLALAGLAGLSGLTRIWGRTVPASNR